MWRTLIYLFVNIKIISTLENEPKDLLHIFIENLKQDPLLLDDYDGVSQKSKRFIDHKVEKFVDLLSQSQQLERSKRSLDEKDANNFINIFPKNILSIKNADDIRLFYQEDNHWFAVSLENQTNLTIYQYQNETFNKLLQYETQYTTNLALLPRGKLPLIAVGEIDHIKVLLFNFKSKTIEVLQTIKTNQPEHVVIWEQEGEIPYLSITETNLTKSNIKIYRWYGRHFDHVQDIPVGNIKKTVPFDIHGSNFLAAVDNQQQSKSYSEIFKFNIHSMQFELFQRLLTNGCTDIKYFTSKLAGENHYFLVVVHATNNESVSVIYKYEDNYFIPFQTLTTDAIEWQPIEDLEGNTALISISKNNLKGFQYNQWRFVETDIVTTTNDTMIFNFADLRTIHTYSFNGEQILVIACDHCQNATNVFKVNFTNFNAIRDLYAQISSWCTDTVKEFEESELIVGETLRGDLNEQIPDEEDQKRQALAALSQSKETLFKIEQTLLPSDEELIFEDDFEANNLIFNNSATFNSLEATLINDVNVDDLFANILNIEKGFSLEDPIEFQVITIKNPIQPEIINKVPLEQYMKVNNYKPIEKLTVNGSITFKQNLNVNNSINNIKISNETLLLQSGDQIFDGNLTLTDLKAENLNTKQISELKSLKVKHLVIGGYLNRVSIPVLVKRALKKSGNQVLEKPFSCDALEVDSFNVDGDISGKKVPDDFVLINSGEYVVGQDVDFLKDLKTNKFEVLSSLNNISVTDEGTLDILLNESPYVQYISTRRTFENIIISNPINLRYKIRNAKMEQYNPVMIDDNSYQINEDVTINGPGEVTRWLKAQDLKPKNAQRSLGTILDKGLKLSDTQVPVYLNFTQPLNLHDIIADKVNSLNPLEWMLESSNTTQIVKGQKTFLGNVHLNGQLNAFRINGVDVHNLKHEALRVVGDQEILGNWKVDRVVAEEGISTNGSSNLTKSMEDIIVVNQTLTLDHLNITTLEIKGTINSQNMSNVLRNFVKKDAIIHKVFGEKSFKELHVDDLIIRDTDLLRLLNDVLVHEITLNKSLDLPNDVIVDKLIFEKNINNLSKENFDELMNLTNSNDDDAVIITSDMEYDEITVIGDVFINDNAINGKNLSVIEEETVKVDEDHEFKSGIIAGATHVDNFLNLTGNIENLDLNTIVEQNAKQLIKIEDKIFQNHLNVNGTLSIDKNVNGMELKKFCTFSEPNEQLKTLKIKGNVVFSKGPKILNINGERIKEIAENVWFSDKAANISASVHLKNATFNKSLNVSGFVGTINLDLLSENYLSKSKKQIISSCITFTNVTFSNISTPILKYKGSINGISIDDVLKRVLIQGEPQIFENTGYFEEVEVLNLLEDAEYTVNNLSLKTDIMRYDQLNIVTGQKTFDNLRVESLNLTHNVKIQKVDILDWLSNAVLTKGVIRVEEKKSFDMATFNQGLSVRGKINGADFTEENIMVVNMPQNITGKKIFLKSTQFKTLMVKGLVNNVDVEKLVQNQTNRHEDSTINSEIIFDNNVEAKNINVDILYDNINVTQLIANVTKLRNLDSFKGKFKDLLNMGMEIEGSLKNQAKLFKYYKEMIHFTDIEDIFGLKSDDGIFRLVAFCEKYNQFQTFEWDDEKGTFVFSGEITYKPSLKPKFMQQVTLGDRDYIYIETPLQNHNDLHCGYLIKLRNPTTFEVVAEFHRTATISLISFVNFANQGCLGFIGNSLSGIDILCDENNYIYYWSQRIGLEGAYKATTLETADSVYLFMARYGQLFNEPSIVIFQSVKDQPDFIEIQTIFERASPNGLAAAFINNFPCVALSFGSQEEAVDSGWISVKKLDNNQFIEWQHIPLTTPQNVHFINQPSFEPLLLVPSTDVSAPLHTFQYEGAAGFKEILKGSSLPISSKIKILANGHFLATLQASRSTGTILGAVVLRN